MLFKNVALNNLYRIILNCKDTTKMLNFKVNELIIYFVDCNAPI